ncbi:MAG: uroporphyrinogen-III C-methyltransferase [Rhodospirillaceae bacterium]|nr:uroporphyrinogen-III C-methyltransferase [Rhodospirillaceae bacterium]MBT5243481.1 uroporphyrinogen-III C-methyltransferase [Rhodospirillaceae bacterium]MBT5562069.1 uroporphyrinogen-III C-methyltransferase [Rhodospirillaceae bacterium]MBT6242242.1 uroporphyrinogen-III C-methyltransferase [Rhodospirillaceae bacterium]MBT7136274.1 uroporphyrinogen-III C-methyltransferase [Rhodospirillaceae bacterium]
MAEKTGKVFLVGAGPGDPELLTVKALNALKKADVIVYDRLVSQQILDLIGPGIARIFVGKAASNHHLAQEDINALLVKLAHSNHMVVRLKGGDPFIFGRGSEEAEYLAHRGVAFEVVPGVTAASGISAALGIPLTHRGLSTGVRFVTGHARAGESLDLDWKSLACEQTTLVFYMGLSNLPDISSNLIAQGLPSDTPAAAISKGTVDGQRQCISTLAGLPMMVDDLDLPSPVLVIVGKVVSLADMLNWQGMIYEDAYSQLELACDEVLSAQA